MSYRKTKCSYHTTKHKNIVALYSICCIEPSQLSSVVNISKQHSLLQNALTHQIANKYDFGRV